MMIAEPMRFVTLAGGQLGAIVGSTLVDLPLAAKQLKRNSVSDMFALVQLDEQAVNLHWSLALDAKQADIGCSKFSDALIRAPILPLRNILCIGKNYRDHVKEVAQKMDLSENIPAKPIVFTKATTAINHPGGDIPAHGEFTSKLDYEGELALIISREGINITRENAWDYIFGFTAMNDISARDRQQEHGQWFLGKSLDGSAPLGPAIVPCCAVANPDELQVQTFVNGELRQDGFVSQMIFDIPTLVSTLSAGMTLLPGDIIATGTPAGVGMGFNPPKYLNPGDDVTIDVTYVGQLRNKIIA